MRIGIEAQRLFRPQKRGMDIYALELIKKLQEIDHHNEYFVFVRPDEDDQCIKSSDNLQIIKLKGYCYADWEQVTLPKALAKYGIDLLHCTANTAPLVGVKSLITTVHDVIFLEEEYLQQKDKGSLYQRFGNLYRKWLVPRIVNSSRQIITVSNYQKERIIHKIGAAASKVKVVYNGVASRFFTLPDQQGFRQVIQKYKLPSRYFFFMGNTDPRKNLRGVLIAYSRLWSRQRWFNQQELPALLINGISQEYLKTMFDELSIQESVRQHIRLTGYIDSEHLGTVYQGASAFLFPSFSEGFGIPIIEAMASGTPVITSVTTSMPEIAGEAALLVDPINTEMLTDAMERVLCDAGLVHTLTTRGRERAKQFSWLQTAQQTLEVYQSQIYQRQKLVAI